MVKLKAAAALLAVASLYPLMQADNVARTDGSVVTATGGRDGYHWERPAQPLPCRCGCAGHLESRLPASGHWRLHGRRRPTLLLFRCMVR